MFVTCLYGPDAEFQSPLWGLDECFPTPSPVSLQQVTPRFSPLYGDWMSASSPSDNAAGPASLWEPFQSPLWGLDECFLQAELEAILGTRLEFQSPLWGLDECFRTTRATCPRSRKRPWFQSPLWGLDECFAAKVMMRIRPVPGGWVSVPFMGIG